MVIVPSTIPVSPDITASNQANQLNQAGVVENWIFDGYLA
jgi:hypothetical protein